MKSIISICIAFSGIVLLQACSSNEIGESKDVSQDKIYQSYSIEYFDGNDNVNINCQFRFAGKNGTTLVLNNPSKITFDNEVLKVDSSGASGAYYATNKPLAGFYGKHNFVFTDINNKKLENDFTFERFALVNTAAGASKKTPLQISFDAGKLLPGDHVELYSNDTDSSFSISYVAGTDTGNVILIPAKELQRQKTKTLSLEAKLYKEIALGQSSTEGGIIRVAQTAKPVQIKLQE